MGIDEVLPRHGAPMPDGMRFHIVGSERFFEQWVVFSIHLRGGNIVGGAPPSIYFGEVFGGVKLRVLHIFLFLSLFVVVELRCAIILPLP